MVLRCSRTMKIPLVDGVIALVTTKEVFILLTVFELLGDLGGIVIESLRWLDYPSNVKTQMNKNRK